MKKVLGVLLLSVVSFAGFSQTWNADKAHAKIGFSIVHMSLSDVDGGFGEYDASFTATKPNLSDAKFDISISVASVNTGNSMRDGHLQKDDMFDAAKNPKITFKSTGIKNVKGNAYKVTGDLTVKGVTKKVIWDAVITGPIEDQRSKKMKAGIKITGSIKRTDFGVSNMPAMALSEEVEIRAVGEFVKD